MSDKKKTTMLDLSSPAFNYTAAADALNTANATHGMREANKSAVELDRREKIHRALQRFGLATAGASMASPLTAIFTETAGGIADFIDGVLYNLEGKHGQATLSYATILPVVGGAVAAKRAMQQSEKAGDKLVDIYHGYKKNNVKGNIVKDGNEEFVVGNQYRYFKELDEDQLKYAFQQSVPNPEDGLRLYNKYKRTGEIPVSLTNKNLSRIDYYGGDVLGSSREIAKSPFSRFTQPGKYLTGSKSQYYTTPRASWATTSIDEAGNYGESILHFKVPKSYISDSIKRNKLRGSDEIFKGTKFEDAFWGRSEMIFDEGIPMRFYHKTLKGKPLSQRELR